MYATPQPTEVPLKETLSYYLNHQNMVSSTLLIANNEPRPSGLSHVQQRSINPDNSSSISYTNMNGSFGEFEIQPNQLLDFGQCHVQFPENLTENEQLETDTRDNIVKYQFVNEEQDQIADISRGNEFNQDTLVLSQQKVFPAPTDVYSPQEGINQLFTLIFTEPEDSTLLQMQYQPEQAEPEVVKLNSRHKFESSEVQAIILNSECSGNTEVKVIWQTTGNIFEIMPGFIGIPDAEDIPKRRRGINEKNINLVMSKNNKVKNFKQNHNKLIKENINRWNQNIFLMKKKSKDLIKLNKEIQIKKLAIKNKILNIKNKIRNIGSKINYLK